MHKGRISEIAYKRSVVKKITDKTEGIRPGVDAAEIKLEDVTTVMSSNCMLKWFETCEDYYVQKTMNCIYEKGGKPQYMQIEINIPIQFEEKRLGKIIRNFNDAALKRSITICQCRVYSTEIDSPIAHITILGTTENKLSCKNIKPGMDVVMAGSIAVGGTAIISAMNRDKLLEKFSNSFVADCIGLREYINIKNAAMVAMSCGAVAMHHVSDGGAFSAIWELVSSVDMGITVNIPDIPVWQETVEVAEVFDINPYLLDGTGALLIVCRNGKEMVDKLTQAGICANVIGNITDSKDRIAINGDETRYLEPPRGDEIYKFI